MLKRVMQTLTVVFGLAALVLAEAPQMINYQGRLTDNLGDPVADGSYSVVFTIYDAAVAGTSVWTENQNVTSTDGQISILLGSVNPILDTVFNGTTRYLGITVGVDPEMTPRTALVTVPYSFRIATIDGASGGEINGKLGINSATPEYTLEVVDPDFAGIKMDGEDNYFWLLRTNTDMFSLVQANDVSGFTRLSIDTIGNVQMALAGGNVGIGSFAPAEKLDVDGNIKASGTIQSGSSIIIDGVNDRITASSGTIDFDDENIVTTGTATIGPGHTNSGSFGFVAGETNLATGNRATISGGFANVAIADNATVGGGQQNAANALSATIAGGQGNIVSLDYGTVGGGFNNAVGNAGSTVSGGTNNFSSGVYSSIGGGRWNRARGDYSVVAGGGGLNDVDSNSAIGHYSSIVGGRSNITSAIFSTVGGGFADTSSGDYSTVSGGFVNVASGNYATVAGGNNNTAAGAYSFVAGRMAKAKHDGCFVWGDSFAGVVASSVPNQFTARTSGGARFYSNTALTLGVTLAAGGGAWAAISDSTVKENIRPVDGAEILEKLSELEITRWNYVSQDASIEHIGPMAQDFYRLFHVGDNNTTITTIDPDGIALAAIQGLYEKVKALESENVQLKATNSEMYTRLDKIEKALVNLGNNASNANSALAQNK